MTPSQSSSRGLRNRAARVALLGELASYRLDDLLCALDVELVSCGKRLHGCCPVHGGDKANALNLYPDGYATRGNWCCRTRGCERVFRNSLIGFVRGVLSHQRNGWTREEEVNLMVSFEDAVLWLCNFLGVKMDELDVNMAELDRRRFIAEMEVMSVGGVCQLPGWPEEQVAGWLNIPSQYYLARGYLPATLRHFSVGESKQINKTHPFYHRAVVPVHDHQGKNVIGATARSLYPRCSVCGHWHEPGPCPEKSQLHYPQYAKWRHSKDLAVEQLLYNFGKAKNDIVRTSQVVVVEGPGDVWRLFEAGVRQSVGLFGVTMEDPQQILIEQSGATEVVLALDSDKAGQEGVKRLYQRLRRIVRVVVVETAGKDMGEMDVNEIATLLEGIVRA